MKRFVLLAVVVIALAGPVRSHAHENEGAEFYGYALGGAVIAQTLGALAGLTSAPPAYSPPPAPVYAYPPPAPVYAYPPPYFYAYPPPYVFSYPPPYPYPRYGYRYGYGYAHPHSYAAPYGSYVSHGAPPADHGSYGYHGSPPPTGYAPPPPYAGRLKASGGSVPHPANYVRGPISAAFAR